MKSRTIVVVSLVAAALGVGAGVVSCDLRDAATCDADELNLTSGFVGDFGADAAAQKIEAFFDSTVALQNAGKDLANSVVAACTNIGTAVGIPAVEMQPTGTSPSDPDRIRAACNRTATEVRSIIQAAIPTGAHLSVGYTPPVCEVTLDAYARCAGECNVAVTPGELTVTCEPGTISVGQCSAGCSGECWLTPGSIECTGSCNAQCTGSCSGACYGTCDGTASSGTCAGECVGQCDAVCTGSCSGQCIITPPSGGCTGECHGSCDVWITPPRCEAFARPPEVDVDCHASCEASLRAEATCTPVEVTVNFGTTGSDPTARARLTTLVGVLRTNLPAVFVAAVKAGAAFVEMIDAFFGALDGLGESLASTADAIACTFVALGAQVQVTATFSASFEASGSITAAVAVEGSATL